MQPPNRNLELDKGKKINGWLLKIYFFWLNFISGI